MIQPLADRAAAKNAQLQAKRLESLTAERQGHGFRKVASSRLLEAIATVGKHTGCRRKLAGVTQQARFAADMPAVSLRSATLPRIDEVNSQGAYSCFCAKQNLFREIISRNHM